MSLPGGCALNGRRLHLKRAFVDATIHDTVKARAALVEKRWRSKVRIPCINRRAPRQQCMSKGWTAVVLQRAKQWVGINLISRCHQETATVIAAEVVAE